MKAELALLPPLQVRLLVGAGLPAVGVVPAVVPERAQAVLATANSVQPAVAATSLGLAEAAAAVLALVAAESAALLPRSAVESASPPLRDV